MPRVVHHDIDVAAPPEACWRVLSDLTTLPAWLPRLKRLVIGRDERVQIGGRFELRFDFGPIQVPVRCTLTDVTANQRIRWTGRGWGITGDHSYALSSRHPGLTRVTSHEEFSGAGTLLMTAAIVERVDREMHDSLARLKALIETTSRAA